MDEGVPKLSDEGQYMPTQGVQQGWLGVLARGDGACKGPSERQCGGDPAKFRSWAPVVRSQRAPATGFLWGL